MTDPTSLQNLHPIVLPPEVGLWPPAPGWYLAAAVLLLIGARIWTTARRRWQRDRYRREGRQLLARVRSRFASGDRESLRELPALLKAAALGGYPRERVAGLYGDRWRTFLNTTADRDLFSASHLRLLEQLSYGPPGDLGGIDQASARELMKTMDSWLKQHRRRETADGGEG